MNRSVQDTRLRFSTQFRILPCVIAFVGLFPAWATVSGPGGSASLNEFYFASQGGWIYWLLPVGIIILFLTALASHDAISNKLTVWQRILFGLCVFGLIVGFIRGFWDAGSTLSSEGVDESLGIGFFITLAGFIITAIGILSSKTFTPKQ
jgi:hypothetical protein